VTAGTAAGAGSGLDDLLAQVPPEETPDLNGAFPRLEESQIQALAAHGDRRQVSRAEVLITEGESEDTFYVVLSGRVSVAEAVGTPHQRVVHVHGAGRFLGDLGMLTSQPAYATSVVVDSGEVLAVPVDRLRAVAARTQAVGDLLLRALGPSVGLTCTTAPGLWPAHVDRNQLELIVLNLAINARDAMPDGGTVTVSLANRTADGSAPSELVSGDYVVLSVADTGTGMDETTLKRAFEPFFTTKEVGKGTGLGLSMVQGIVAQSGGATRLHSVLGEGTTVEIWLPRAREAPAASGAPRASSCRPTPCRP